ncbi:MAG: DUF4296 domain-containing protein [Rhodothermales bacterium]
MRRLALVAVLVAGCGSESPSAPDLTDSLMVDVLVEIHLADARASHTGEPRDSLRAAALAAFDTDTVAFNDALDYYARHPEAYQPLYERALDRLLNEQRGAAPPPESEW